MTLSKNFVFAPDCEKVTGKNLQAYQYKKLLSQIITVSNYSVTLLGSFYNKAETATNDLEELYERLSKLEQALPALQERLIKEPFQMTEVEKPQLTIINSSYLSKESRPQEMAVVYEKCKKPPQLHRLDEFRSDGKTCMQFYSNPNFFVEEWKKVMERESEEKKKKRKEKKALKEQHNKQFEVAQEIGAAPLDPQDNNQSNTSLNQNRKVAEVEYEEVQDKSPESYVMVDNSEPAPLPEVEEEFDPEKLFSTIDDLIPGLAGLGLAPEQPIRPAFPMSPPQFGMPSPGQFQLPTQVTRPPGMPAMPTVNDFAQQPLRPTFPLRPPSNSPIHPQTVPIAAPTPPQFIPPQLSNRTHYEEPEVPQFTAQFTAPPQMGFNATQFPNLRPMQSVNAPPPPMAPANVPTPPPAAPAINLPPPKLFAAPALRKVEAKPEVKPVAVRDGMLSDIKSGIQLKKVELKETVEKAVKKEDTTVAGILMRRVALEMSDSDGDDHEDDEDWD